MILVVVAGKLDDDDEALVVVVGKLDDDEALVVEGGVGVVVRIV